MLYTTCFAQKQDSTDLQYGRLAVVGGAVASSFVASYYLVLQNGWWSEEGNDFHFANDFDYASNLDKLGHFYGGYMIAEGLRDGLQWSGVGEKSSYIWSGALSSLVQVAIDIKDGYAPGWGYSVWDVGAGSIGAFFPMAQRYVPGFDYLDLKFSYWRNSEAYWEVSGHTHIDDYTNQTYWVGLDMHRLTGKSWWPAWVQPAVGASINSQVYVGPESEKSWELYFSLDWKLTGMFSPENPTAKRLLWYLDRVKLPSPTVQFYPHWELQLLYPIVF